MAKLLCPHRDHRDRGEAMYAAPSAGVRTTPDPRPSAVRGGAGEGLAVRGGRSRRTVYQRAGSASTNERMTAMGHERVRCNPLYGRRTEPIAARPCVKQLLREYHRARSVWSGRIRTQPRNKLRPLNELLAAHHYADGRIA